MDRRQFIQVGGVAATGSVLMACGRAAQPDAGVTSPAQVAPILWRMVTSWPSHFPGPGTAAEQLAEMIGRMSGNRLQIKVYPAGDLVSAFEVFDAVSQGTAEMGHSAACYWKGQSEAAQFFAAVPFGMNAQEMNGWLYHGGGLELWHELYASFNLIAFPAGNTGVQLAGWFRNEINSLADLKGLRMRIPGLGGEVLSRLGGVPVNLPVTELLSAMQTGALDAIKWMGPSNDLDFGLHQVANYAYYPGWQEPGTTLECMINQRAFDALPDDLQAIVESACRAINDDMLVDCTTQNQRALEALINAGVQFRQLPDEVIAALRSTSAQVLADLAERDAFTARVYQSYQAFHKGAKRWHQLSEAAFYVARD